MSETKWYDPGTGQFIVVDGHIVERDALRIAEAIKDYDDNLELLCLDPGRAAGISDAPFLVAERCPDGVLRPVFKAWELNDELLHRIWQSDQQKFDGYARLEEMELASKREKERRYLEFREEAKDIVKSIAGMKSSYIAPDPGTGENVKFFDDRPAERQ
jgi:hypothetical protein